MIFNEHCCDGILACDIGWEDELIDGPCSCSDRFICNSSGLVSIPLDQKCDGWIDCDDSEDEFNKDCLQSRFKCPAVGGIAVSVFLIVVGVLSKPIAVGEHTN